MKVTLQCVHCLLERAINQTRLATDDPELQMQVAAKMLDFLSKNLDEHSVPSHIGTDRDLLVQEMTGKDPYHELKIQSNEMALGILSELSEIVDESGDIDARFRKATLIAAAANAIEFDVSGRDFSLDELRDIISHVEADLAVDEIAEFKSLVSEAKEVVFLHDNAGEVVLDMILIREIKNLGPKVIAVVKSGPILNDATLVDAEQVGLNECADEVMATGAAAIGVNLERSSNEFKDLLSNAELIVAKGMGNYESMTELEPTCPIIHILRTKCIPVANHVGVEKNKNVILIRGI
ncbi:MAG: hypothetical protein BAJATHORv1_10473 [Candidatus Thorarchaeota archaeon]|nr:MAG: hypothetical protein BAJATHORv1_10473 [Candidatus Thorarchaeota archaeon]